MTALGHPVMVANTRQLRASRRVGPSVMVRMRRCWRVGSRWSGVAEPGAPPQRGNAACAGAAQVCEALVRNRVNLINSVRLLLKSLGVFGSSSIKATAFTRKVRAQLGPNDTALVTAAHRHGREQR
jgi:hypothetical protein